MDGTNTFQNPSLMGVNNNIPNENNTDKIIEKLDSMEMSIKSIDETIKEVARSFKSLMENPGELHVTLPTNEVQKPEEPVSETQPVEQVALEEPAIEPQVEPVLDPSIPTNDLTPDLGPEEPVPNLDIPNPDEPPVNPALTVEKPEEAILEPQMVEPITQTSEGQPAPVVEATEASILESQTNEPTVLPEGSQAAMETEAPTLEPQVIEPIAQQSEIQPAAPVEEASVAPAIEQQAVEPIVQNSAVQTVAAAPEAPVQEPQTIDENNGFKSIDSLLNESQSDEPVVNNTVNTPIVEQQAPVNVAPQIQEPSVDQNINVPQENNVIKLDFNIDTAQGDGKQRSILESDEEHNNLKGQQQAPVMAPTMVLTPAA